MRISRYPASWQEVKHSGLEATGLPEELDHGLVCGNGRMGQISTTQSGRGMNLIMLQTSTTLLCMGVLIGMTTGGQLNTHMFASAQKISNSNAKLQVIFSLTYIQNH